MGVKQVYQYVPGINSTLLGDDKDERTRFSDS